MYYTIEYPNSECISFPVRELSFFMESFYSIEKLTQTETVNSYLIELSDERCEPLTIHTENGGR